MLKHLKNIFKIRSGKTAMFCGMVLLCFLYMLPSYAGDPSRFIPVWKEAGIKVFPVVPAVALAKLVAKRGADGVIAEGTESGGHVGELTTMALVPQVAEAVDPVFCPLRTI